MTTFLLLTNYTKLGSNKATCFYLGLFLFPPFKPSNLIETRKRERVCSDSKRGSYIPWNPTSSRKAHENVFIRNDLSLMCRGLSFHCCVLWGEQNREGYETPKRTISTQVRSESRPSIQDQCQNLAP